MKRHFHLLIIFLVSMNTAFASSFIYEDKYSNWGVSKKNTVSSINVYEAWKNFKKKKDVVVAVVDTGVDPNHPFLKDNLYFPGRALSADKAAFGYDFSKNSKKTFRPYDDHGHGTHIAGIIKSVFPKVKIVSLKYYNPKASDEDNLKSTIAALKKAIDLNVDIINYSSGGAGASRQERAVLKEAERKGILVVAAAGNEGSNIDKRANHYYPASYDLENILTVVNHDRYGKLNSSSNYGQRTADVSAPGTRIRASLPYGRIGSLTGTSQSTAFVSGIAALLKAQFPHLSSKEVKNIIIKSAKSNPYLKGKCLASGRVDARAAQELASQYKKIAFAN